MKSAEVMNEVGKKRKHPIKDDRREFERLLEEKITKNYLRKCVNIHTVKAAGEEILEEKPHFKEALGYITLAPRYIYDFLKRGLVPPLVVVAPGGQLFRFFSLLRVNQHPTGRCREW